MINCLNPPVNQLPNMVLSKILKSGSGSLVVNNTDEKERTCDGKETSLATIELIKEETAGRSRKKIKAKTIRDSLVVSCNNFFITKRKIKNIITEFANKTTAHNNGPEVTCKNL